MNLSQRELRTLRTLVREKILDTSQWIDVANEHDLPAILDRSKHLEELQRRLDLEYESLKEEVRCLEELKRS